MERIVTLPERKAAEAQRRQQAVASLRPVLAAYARAHGGRFLLYGSAARGEMRHDSDVDILVDFPEDQDGRASARIGQGRKRDPAVSPRGRSRVR